MAGREPRHPRGGPVTAGKLDEAEWSALMATDGQDGGPVAAGRSTWRPVDLEDVLAGRHQPPQPTVGRRDDKAGLFYPGRVHSIASESEAGKTWLALHAVASEIRDGHAAIYLDFEDDEAGVVGRLLALGVDKNAIRHRFGYLRPENSVLADGNRADLAQALGDLRPTLAILDGVTEAMTAHGLDPLSNADVARFGKMLPRWIADQGPAVASLDHVVKDRENRGRHALGGIHKINQINGAAYILENRTPFGIGVTGRSAVHLAKDRPGQLRKHALPTSGGMHWWADLVLESHDATFVEASLTAPTAQAGTFRPTVLMQNISAALTRAGKPLSVRGVLDRVSGKRDKDVIAALAALVDEGFVLVETGPRGAHLHRLIKPFEQGTP